MNQTQNLFPFYKGNKEALKARYPEYYDMVLKTPVNINYELVKTKTNLEGLKIRSLNKHFYDPDNPIAGVEKIMHTYDLRGARLILCIGFGLGYDPIYYMEQVSRITNTEYMIVVEKDPALFHMAMKLIDLKQFLEQPRVELFLGVEEKDMFAKMAKWFGGENRYYNARAFQVIYNINSFELDNEYYEMVMRKFAAAFIYAVNNYGNDTEDSLIGTENMLKNISMIINNPGVNLLKDKFKGLPGIVLATGPSLSLEMDKLKGLEDKAIFIACDASLKPMLNHGIKPHVVTSLEREMAVVQLVEGLKVEQVEDVYLMACPVVYPEVYAAYPGKNIIIYRQFDHFKWLKIERGMLDIKYSAGNMAFKVAEYLGCDPIILIGQDLALSRSGKTNAEGATLGDEQESYLREQRMMVPANNGPDVETTASLKLFFNAYEIDMANHKGLCINTSKDGAYIAGTKYMPFKEVIEKYIQKSINPLEIIKGSIDGFKPEEGTKERIIKQVEHAIEEFEYMANICHNGFECVLSYKSELEKEIDEQRTTKILHDIIKWKGDLQRDKDVWQLLFAHVGQSYFLNFEIEVKGLPGKNESTIAAMKMACLMHEEYYKIMEGIMNVMIKILKEARERL